MTTAIDLANQLRDLLDDNAGEITLEVETLEGELDAKLSAIVHVMREKAANAEANKMLAADYQARANAQANQAGRLKSLLDVVMRAAGIEKRKLPTATLYYQSTKSVVLDARDHEWVERIGNLDTSDAWERYVRVTERHEPNRDAIRAALDAGVPVPGASIVNNSTIRVR
jgi:hypothetical protein